MGKKGYLKIAMDKVTKKGNPFVSLLILDAPDSEDGTWMSLFDAWFFGGSEDKPSPYDIRRYADRDNPQPVVYESEEKNGFTNCLRIRPENEQWELPEGFAAVKGEAKPMEKLIDREPTPPGEPYSGPLEAGPIHDAMETIKRGLDQLEEALR